jgi:hypothetical protein
MPNDVCSLAESVAGLKKPPQGAVLTPWVKVKFVKAKNEITVGNASSASNSHHAVIKDFEFGHDDGAEARITIIDEQGSSFVDFMDTMLKDFKCITPDEGYSMDVQFGWTGADCPNGEPVSSSQVFKLMCRDIIANFSGGKFVFEITGTDITEPQFEGRISEIFYGADKELYLTEAIRQLFTDNRFEPVIKSVKFLKIPKFGKDGKPGDLVPVRWKGGGSIDPEKGPLGKWQCNTMSKIDIAHHWLKDYLTEDGKSLRGAYNSEVEGGEVIFWEDLKPNCGQQLDWDTYSLGTYIVNGGKDSCVLEFSTKVKWNFMGIAVAGGNMGEDKPTGTPEGGKQPGVPDCPSLQRGRIKTAGAQTTGAADENARANYGADANKKVMEAQQKQIQYINPFMQSIEAEMTITGDPTIPQPMYCLWRNVHIIFINPSYILGGERGENEFKCGDWTAKPACNAILSNKAWRVYRVSHRIADGRFTTSLQLSLDVPGVDLSVDDPLGGAGSEGWTPVRKC